MASITDHVIKLQELTQRNLEILQVLNDSFFTNQNHLSVNVGESHYAIPSFISLENKLNVLTANFENLVNAPETGEAFFDFNGNSRAIQVRSYTSVPQSIVLEPVVDFSVDKNDIFKDFLTPCPYINLDLQSLPNDTTQVMVKKVIPLNSELKKMFESLLVDNEDNSTIYKTSIKYNYKELYKTLSVYKEDVDYIEYDTKVDLPIRENIGSGIYVIEDIIEDIVDDNLDNYITIKFRTDLDDPTYMNSLKYRLFNETIEKMLKVGDQLVTFEGNAKMEIIEVRPTNNTVKVKVLYGEFLNLVPSKDQELIYVSPLSKIKFYSPIDFNKDKYVKVPLEEDKYVFISVAALNSRMNVQSSWGGGLMLNTYELKNGDKKFDTYYKENVKNVGDVLYEMTALMDNTIMKYSKEEYDSFTQLIPSVDKNVMYTEVVQINKHLDDSETITNIRKIHSQKIDVKSKITEKQNEIDSVRNALSTISFDDVTGQRASYISRENSLLAEKNSLLISLSKLSDSLAQSANNSEVPIENAKYRIRGYYDTSDLDWSDHIVGIRVQYRYKNSNSDQNKAFTINDKFVFSDWNEMSSSDRERIPVYQDGTYKSVITPKNDNVNEPSFNQIDIPISQGETVDIRVKLIYDFGAPFVQTSSKWSSIVNVEFPKEKTQEVKILDIISENNDDIETYRFSNIIREEGILDHVGDKVVDQDVTFFHKPENISSGFYTEERRVIPLKDKLSELNNLIVQLKDEILGTQNTELKVSIKNGNMSTPLTKYGKDKVLIMDYSKMKNVNDLNGYKKDPDTGIISTVLYISIVNDSNNSTKLFSMFPGDRSSILNGYKNGKFSTSDYCIMNETTDDFKYNKTHKVVNYFGVWMEQPETTYIKKPYENILNSDSKILTNWPISGTPIGLKNNQLTELTNITLQTCNQFLYFRMNSAYGDKILHDVSNVISNLLDDTGVKLNIDACNVENLSSGFEFNINDKQISSSYPKETLTEFFKSSERLTQSTKWMGYKYVEERNTTDNSIIPAKSTCMYVYPKLTTRMGLNIETNSNYLIINPKEEILIPLVVEYYCDETILPVINKTLSFDIWPSLYKDPVNYTFTIEAKYESDIEEQILVEQQNQVTVGSKYNIVYK